MVLGDIFLYVKNFSPNARRLKYVWNIANIIATRAGSAIISGKEIRRRDTMSTTQLRRELGRKGLFGIAATGRSVNLAMALSAVWVILIGIYYVLTIIPILPGIDIDKITNSVLACMYLCMMITSVAAVRLPKLFPDEWSRSPFKCGQGTLTFLCSAAAVVSAIQVCYSSMRLSKPILPANIGPLSAAILYAPLRHHSGSVKMNISY